MKLDAVLTHAQRTVLADLRERDRAERDQGIRESMSLKAVAPEVAELLYMLARQQGARAIVEFGTSHGYSTIHLAAAAEATEGHVYTVDAMPEKTALATANLKAAGLRERATLVSCDGAEFAASLPNGIDFVLVDYGLPAFVPAFVALREKLAPGCFVFVDGGYDGYWDSGGGRDFRLQLEDDPAFLVARLPMRKEQLIALRVGGGP